MAETIAADELETLSEPLSTEAIHNDAQPKRRGRPPGSKNKPRLFGISSGTEKSPAQQTRGARGGSRAWIRQQWVGLIGFGNIGLSFLSKDDCLTEAEMDALTDAMVAETMSSERILKWMTTASKITPHILLANVLVAIAIPRLQRRGIIPAPQLSAEQQEQVDEYLRHHSAVQTNANGSATGDNASDAVQMETGRTSLTNW